MTTQITTTENKQVATMGSQALSDSGISVSDIRPSYISVMQKMSKAVDQGICKPGDILETPVNIVLGGEGKPIEVFPLFMRKEWNSYFKDQKDNKPFRKVPYDASNSHWKYDDIVDGKAVKNDMVIIWYVLPVGEDTLPAIISFRGMSGRAGSNVTQMVARLGAARKPSYSKTIKLDSVKEQNDKGTYYVFKTSFGRDANPKELESAKMWQEMFSKKPVATHDDEEAVPF